MAMRVFNVVSLALFVIGSFALNVPEDLHLKDETKGINYKDLTIGRKKWVVLVAGSSEWVNYRHQADVCHAYHIVRRNGIPTKNIITMMVDDIAYNPNNPTPGKIINRPNGPDVYKGVVIDYKGKDVNSNNFLNIIKGNKTAMQNIGSGKVIEGGPLDTIFINFVDHGSTGLFAFPEDLLYADQLNDAFKTMYKLRSYRQMLLYIEACFSGSMFDGTLPENTNILAVTAAGPRESSYACYCDFSETDPYQTCLSDLFSMSWMENIERTVSTTVAKKRTVFNEFKAVRTNVTNSNVMVYGDFRTGHSKLSKFIGYHGNSDDGSLTTYTALKKYTNSVIMPSDDIEENIILNQLSNEKLSKAEKHDLIQKLNENNNERLLIDSIYRNIYSMIVKARPNLKDQIGDLNEPKHLTLRSDVFPCYRSILNKLTKTCFSLPRNPYSMKHLTIFANSCVVDNQIDQMINELIDVACSDIQNQNINNVF